ncbi:MAG: hypothetical protein CR997_10015 [Acidobacteria bacterium]|nr:MAG: hypothetical protein CR997_10015 [Acidobacteriota bacterium]
MKKTPISLILISIAWSFYPSLAQTNVEKFRGEGSINLMFSFDHDETKTTDSKTLLAALLVNKVKGVHEYLAVYDTEVEDKDDVNYKNKNFLHLRYYRHITNWGFEGFFQRSEDDFSNQLKRKLWGLGVRKTIEREKYSLRGGLSLFAEELRLSSEVEGETVISDLDMNRFNTYLSLKQKYLTVTVYFQPNIDDTDDRNLAFESVLTFALWKERVKLDIIYNSKQNSELDIKNHNFKQVLRVKW